jgi:hypothetical protein
MPPQQANSIGVDGKTPDAQDPLRATVGRRGPADGRMINAIDWQNNPLGPISASAAAVFIACRARVQ